MGTLSFLVANSNTLESVSTLTPSVTIYAEDLGLCQYCIDITESCWACLTTSQQVFNDEALTSSVSDGYYLLNYSNGSNAVWYIVGGYPQESNFLN